jgi:hypothetical protein
LGRIALAAKQGNMSIEWPAIDTFWRHVDRTNMSPRLVQAGIACVSHSSRSGIDSIKRVKAMGNMVAWNSAPTCPPC